MILISLTNLKVLAVSRRKTWWINYPCSQGLFTKIIWSTKIHRWYFTILIKFISVIIFSLTKISINSYINSESTDLYSLYDYKTIGSFWYKYGYKLCCYIKRRLDTVLSICETIFRLSFNNEFWKWTLF